MDNLVDNITQTIKRGDTYNIVFLGDSITSTEWVHPNWREILEYVLKEEVRVGSKNDWQSSSWGIRCFNAGFDGATSQDMLTKLDKHVLQHNPSLVILLGTINDMDSGLSTKQHKNNFSKIIQTLESNNVDTVICTSTPSLNKEYNNKYAKYANTIKSLAPFPKSTFINMFEEYKQFDLKQLFTFVEHSGNEVMGIKPGDIDFAHPNSLGNAYIAKILLNQLFSISFNPDQYIKDARSDIKYPKY